MKFKFVILNKTIKVSKKELFKMIELMAKREIITE